MASKRVPKYTLTGSKPDATFVERVNELFQEVYRLLSQFNPHDMLSSVHGDTRVDPETGVRRGDLIVGQSTPQGADHIKWQRFAIGDANTVLRTNGEDPEWGKVELDADVSEILPVANGGTGVATFTEHAVVVGGAGTAPLEQVVGLGSSGQVLTSNGAGNKPTWQDAQAGGEWSVLTNGDVATPELIFAGGDVIMTFIP